MLHTKTPEGSFDQLVLSFPITWGLKMSHDRGTEFVWDSRFTESAPVCIMHQTGGQRNEPGGNANQSTRASWANHGATSGRQQHHRSLTASLHHPLFRRAEVGPCCNRCASFSWLYSTVIPFSLLWLFPISQSCFKLLTFSVSFLLLTHTHTQKSNLCLNHSSVVNLSCLALRCFEATCS